MSCHLLTLFFLLILSYTYSNIFDWHKNRNYSCVCVTVLTKLIFETLVPLSDVSCTCHVCVCCGIESTCKNTISVEIRRCFFIFVIAATYVYVCVVDDVHFHPSVLFTLFWIKRTQSLSVSWNECWSVVCGNRCIA